ncbi:MAG: hypothetical protein HQL52_03125 [Magnetococcales bacterium]|nr:hypothetical protein [Magnetococcales bacterium]
MIKRYVSAGLLMILVALPAPHALAKRDPVSALPVRSVALFASGVGFFQHAGQVAGGDVIKLPFKSAQINDVLKSLVLENLDGGQPGFVVYPSRDPLAKTLGGFQVNLNNHPTLAQILGQLRGAQVVAVSHDERISGHLLGAEMRPMAVDESGKPVSDWVVNLSTGQALRALPLKEIQALEIQDPVLKDELDKALKALDQGRGKDKKPVSIRFPGSGDHRVRVGYVVETPVWKNSYRLILPEKAGEATRIQGWAIVENQTDNDWENIRLSLVSGQPVSFIQDLYEPLYASRPRIEPQRPMALQPQKYEGGVGGSRAYRGMKESAKTAKSYGRSGPMMAMAPPAPMEMMDADALGEADWEEGTLNPTGIAAAAQAQEAGELFQFSVEGVSLPRRRAAMIPIVADTIKSRKVSIYNQQNLVTHPMNGVLLENTTGLHLPPGPVTLFDGGLYGGDAQLTSLPPGETRLVSHAVDLEVKVLPPTDQSDSTVTSGKVVKGVLTLTRKLVSVRQYQFENSAEEEKQLIIEHPLRGGWTLTHDTPAPLESTPQWHRFELTAPPGKTTPFQVRAERIQYQRITLLHGDVGGLSVHLGNDAISRPIRRALQQVIKRKQALEETRRGVAENEQLINELKREQERIHANMRAVRAGSKFHTRMVKKLDDREDAIEAAQEKIQQLRERLDKQRADLEKHLKDLDVG